MVSVIKERAQQYSGFSHVTFSSFTVKFRKIKETRLVSRKTALQPVVPLMNHFKYRLEVHHKMK